MAYFKTIFQHLQGGLLRNTKSSNRRPSPWDEIQSDNHSLTMLYGATVKTVLITGS
jgi:hypothetical protein